MKYECPCLVKSSGSSGGIVQKREEIEDAVSVCLVPFLLPDLLSIWSR